MENKDFIIEEEVLINIADYSEAPYREAPYRVVCYDGYAEGTLIDSAEFPNAPATIRMEYPKLEDVLKDSDRCLSILFYRGLWDKTADDIHYGDIMMYLGEIVS